MQTNNTITKEEIAKGYDSILDRMGLDTKFYSRVTSIQKNLYGNVLDLGCGTGNLLEILKNKAGKDVNFFGLDISPKLVEAAQKRNPEAKIVVGDAENLPYVDNTFDIVFMTECLEHLLNFKKALSEVNRVLKPGGKFIVTVPNRDWLQYDFYKPFMEKNVHQPVDDYYFRYDELRDLLTSSNFEIKDVKGSDNLFYYGWKHEIEQIIARIYPPLYKKMKRLILLCEKV